MTRLLPFALVAVAVALRLLAIKIAPQPVVSDGQAYLHMATTLAAGGPMRDIFGQAAFYSPGYPLLLAPFFAVAGASASVALLVNTALAGITVLLIYRVTLRLTNNDTAALIAGAAYAVWIPALLGAGMLAKENLSVPLLLGFVLTIIAVIDGVSPARAALVGGLCYGAGLLAGASTLFVAAAFVLALWLRRDRRVLTISVAFAIGAGAVLTPWLVHTRSLFGTPLLTTNGGFNLYLGNNPAATGCFVSIAETPAGPRWHAMHDRLGEAGSAEALGVLARDYAAANPARTASLAATKLGLFWMPNVPDAADDVAGARGFIRWLDVVQHLAIVVLALAGAWTLRRKPGVAIIGATILAFWVIHAATYVIPRYRDPIMPLMIVLAAAPLIPIVQRRSRA